MKQPNSHRCLLIALVLMMGVVSKTQNLVPNPSFEEYNWCPGGFIACEAYEYDSIACHPWRSWQGSYFNACSDWPCDVPDNFRGFQNAQDGNAYVGAYLYDVDAGGESYMEYFDVFLLEPLVAGECYEVSFYVNLADSSYGCGISHIGVFFTQGYISPWELIGSTPQIEAGGQFYSDMMNWTHVVGHFIAEGGEDHLIIGNFREQEDCLMDPGCNDPDGLLLAFSFYYFDNVVVQLSEIGDPFTVDLGGPYTECDGVVLSTGIQDAFYHWSDGSAGPNLIVTESGTYSVTVSSHCQTAEATTEVTILGSDPVNLGTDITICAGENYTITLDPFAGEYIWSDGSTGNEFEIITGGIHSVTLDDGCGLTSDEIDVTLIEAPPPFSLGEDTTICGGESILLAFDPALGDFEWQDGSTAFFYIINEPGVYGVTITNPCGFASDEIVVNEGIPPVFNLEPDTVYLCAGEVLVLNLDGELGDIQWQDGSMSESYEVSVPGVYSVTVTNGCGAESDQVVVIAIEAPAFELGSLEYLCIGDVLILEVSDTYGSYTWQDGSAHHEFIVTEPGVYSLTITNDCGTYHDDVIVEIVPDIVPPDLGPDIAICPGQKITLSIDQTTGDILWNDLSTDDSLVVSVPGTYFVTVFTVCGAYSDTVFIVGNSEPQLNLPTELFICPGDTLYIEAGIEDVGYLWSDGSTLPQIPVFAPGLYALTVTSACGSDSDTVAVESYSSLSPPDLGPDFSLCPGETGVLYANVDGVSYQWSDGATGTIGAADSIVITAPGIYSLQISDACTSASDTIVITLNANPPDVDLPDVVDLCQGDSVVIDAGITGVQYQWEGGTATSSMTIYTPGTYGLTVSNACGMDIDSVVINDAGAEPLVMLGADTSLCPGDVVEIIPAAMDVDTWLWQDSSTSSSLFASTGGVVYVTGSNQCGSASDTIIVNMLPDIPVLDLGEVIAICPGETVTLAITEPDVEIVWHDNSINNQYVVSGEGLVYATITNDCGSSSDTVSVEQLPAIPDLDLGADQLLCPGETITLDPAIPDVEYLWQDGSDEAIYATSIPGAIILTISNSCGSSTDTVEVITDTDGPQVDLGEDVLACEGDTVILDAGISGVDYLWQDGTIASHFIATISGLYHLAVSNACGSDADTIVVDIHGTIPAPALGQDTTLCDGEMLLLRSDANDETTILWQDGSDDAEFLIAEAGIYILYETNHCGAASDTMMVAYQSAPVAFDLGEDVVICPGDTIILFAPITNDLVTWSVTTGGVTIDSIRAVVYAPNTITLTISNDCGIASDDVVVAFDQYVPVVELEPLLSICPDQSVILDVTQSFDASYLWNTGSTLPAISITQADVYEVTVSTECYSEVDEVIIESSDDCDEHEIFIPNVFSPNGDNVNDEWVVYINDPNVIGIECRVFDRWGDVVFEDISAPVSWSGDFKGKGMMPGVYVYVVTLENRNGERTVLSGDVTLIR